MFYIVQSYCIFASHATLRAAIAASVRFEPVVARAALGDKGYAQPCRTLHGLGNDAAHGVDLRAQRVDDHLVVHLQYHARAYTLREETASYLDHRYLHYIGRRALYGRVYGVAFGQRACYGVARVDVGEDAPPPEYSLDIAPLFGLLDHLVHIALDIGIRGEVTVDYLLGLLARYVETLAQTECRYAVYDAEVGGLGPPPLVVGNLVDALAVEPCRRCGVDVATLDEGFDKRIVAAQMRHEPQLDLRVIGRQQQMILIGGDEGCAYGLAKSVADRNVLQVGVGRRQPAGGRDGLIV